MSCSPSSSFIRRWAVDGSRASSPYSAASKRPPQGLGAARLELEPPADLERARAARSEDLADPLRRLSKRCRVVQVEVVAAEIRVIENVEALAEHREHVALAERELLGQAEILRVERPAEAVVLRQGERRDRLPARVRLAGVGVVPIRDGARQ